MENWDTADRSLTHFQMQVIVFITCISGELLNQIGTSLTGKKDMLRKVRTAILGQTTASSSSLSFLAQRPVRDTEARLSKQAKHTVVLCQNTLPAINSFRTSQRRSICSCVLSTNGFCFYVFLLLLLNLGRVSVPTMPCGKGCQSLAWDHGRKFPCLFWTFQPVFSLGSM